MRAAPIGLLKLIFGLFGGDELVDDIALGLQVLGRDGSTELDGVGIRIKSNHLGTGELVLEFRHFDVVDSGQALLGGVIFCVFAQIALCTGIN